MDNKNKKMRFCPIGFVQNEINEKKRKQLMFLVIFTKFKPKQLLPFSSLHCLPGDHFPLLVLEQKKWTESSKKPNQKIDRKMKNRSKNAFFYFSVHFFFHFEKNKLKQLKNNIQILRIWAKKGPKKWAKTAHKMVKIKKNYCHHFFWLETTQQYGTSRFHTMF